MRALERTGEVRAAAVDAGVDFTTAYARRKAHAGFAAAWAEALRARRERAEGEERMALDTMARGPSTIASSGNGPPPHPAGREELFASTTLAGAKLKRVGEGRWSQRKERVFFTELAASANVRRAAAAAGVSTQAVYARRLRQPAFARQWEAAVESGKARLQMLLIAAASQSFDPDLLADEANARQVSVGEAINILKTREGKERAGQSLSGRGWQGGEEESGEGEYEAACEGIIERLKRLGERSREEQAEAGWRWCEEHQVMVPPGLARPEEMIVADGGPRAGAALHCPHCRGGLSVARDKGGQIEKP